jgi:toxin FitB
VLQPGAAADRLGTWVDSIETTFADRVLPVDVTVARLWGKLSAGRSLPVIDGLIAATAMIHGLTLAARNTRDVEFMGVSLVDPWQVR